MPTATPHHHPALARHVRCCIVDRQLILLDARRGKYLGLGAREWTGLHPLIAGLPVPVAGVAPPDPAGLDRLIGRLNDSGLLASHGARTWSPPPIEEPVSSLNALDLLPSPEVSTGQVLRFVRAVTGAALALRMRSMETIEGAVSRRQHGLADLDAKHPPRSVLHAVAVYEWLRPLMLSARDRCLLDSLALVGFLASSGIASRWVIGVKTAPFGAHAWVQREGVVLNDQHTRARAFTPILVA
jgi:Transglutaminase-like superfamily